MLTEETDREIVRRLQAGLPLVSRPFGDIAARVGLTEEEVMDRVRALLDGRYLRRFGAALRHQRVGFAGNALVAWKVPPERLDEVGRTVAGFPGVTHCYHREGPPHWPYNLYSMVHKPTREACQEYIRELAGKVKVDDYLVLFSERELKRTRDR
ncbi:MAG: AsnC family transcriptional regulator, partial [Thermoanaerobacterales bacterium]|nr:AsnC family transcriptional regulator [Thermoanaerobacterales bacterium]